MMRGRFNLTTNVGNEEWFGMIMTHAVCGTFSWVELTG